MISERISDDIRPQMEILNMVIPILMLFCSFVSNWSVASCVSLHVITKRDIINDVKLFRHYTCVLDGTREARVVQWDAGSYIQDQISFSQFSNDLLYQ